MDFTNSVFRANEPYNLPTDTANHVRMAQSCRFGWTATPSESSASSSIPPLPTTAQPKKGPAFTYARTSRLASCRGRLYHQLTCSHRVRTDLVEDCGSNCLDPSGAISKIPFRCHECVEREAAEIWKTREAQHNAGYPPIDQMTTTQYESWYSELRQLEAQFSRDRRTYDLGLTRTTRASNASSSLEMSREENDFASELDSLSMSWTSLTNDTVKLRQPQHRQRTNLPNDPSEQLHWNLNSLTIDRGSCGVEYSVGQPTQSVRSMDEGNLWKQVRKRG